MKAPTLGTRDRRAVLIGLAILIPSLGWIWGVRPLRAAIAETNDRVVAERDALSRERAAVAEAARNPARQRFADSAMKASAARVFTGANDVAAGASLASYLGDVAKSTHVWLASAATRNATGARGATIAPPEGIRQLRVELRAESDFQGILRFLDALERGEKVVTVERLDIARTLRAGDESRETLSFSATVVGYSLARSASAEPGATGRGGDVRGGAKP